jgi:hypothetical protein
MKVVWTLLFTILWVTPLAVAGTEDDPALSPAQLKKLDAGEVLVDARKIEGHEVPETTMHAVVDAPPQEVWKIVTCKVTAAMPFPLPTLVSTTRGIPTERDGFWQRKWELIEGDYKINRGAWTIRYFQDDKNRALASYRLHAVPKMPLPSSILEAAQKKTLPGLAKRLRKEVALAGKAQKSEK